jgi:hypothetical protein
MSWERRFKMEEENKNVETGAEGEVMTFDEILADKHYQSEFDKKVAKALETAKTKWEQDAEVKRTEAEKLAKMDSDEKHKYELEKAFKEKEEAISKLNAYELKEEAIKIASGKELPISLLSVIDYTKENAESIKTKIDEIEVVYKQAIQSGINDRMKEKTPKTVVETPTTNETPIMF